MLPHLQDRPLTMKRYPNGVDDQMFFEKHLPGHAPAWIRHAGGARRPAEGRRRSTTPSWTTGPSLMWPANLATIEFHVPLWHVGRRRVLPAPPDHMVFDLDPGQGATIVECCRVAAMVAGAARRSCRLLAQDQRLQGPAALRPATGRPTWERVRDRAHGDGHPAGAGPGRPGRVEDAQAPAPGQGADRLEPEPPGQDDGGRLLVAGPAEPTVSTPVTWDEVDACARSGDPTDLRFTSDLVLRRVEDLGDLFAAV